MDHAAASVMPLLRRGVNAGLWTLEDLDVPSAGWKYNLVIKVADHPKGPVREIDYYGKQHRNLLRDHYPEAVEVVNPRDFEPVKADQRSALQPDQPHVHLEGESDSSVNHGDIEF